MNVIFAYEQVFFFSILKSHVFWRFCEVEFYTWILKYVNKEIINQEVSKLCNRGNSSFLSLEMCEWDKIIYGFKNIRLSGIFFLEIVFFFKSQK